MMANFPWTLTPKYVKINCLCLTTCLVYISQELRHANISGKNGQIYEWTNLISYNVWYAQKLTNHYTERSGHVLYIWHKLIYIKKRKKQERDLLQFWNIFWKCFKTSLCYTSIILSARMSTTVQLLCYDLIFLSVRPVWPFTISVHDSSLPKWKYNL